MISFPRNVLIPIRPSEEWTQIEKGVKTLKKFIDIHSRPGRYLNELELFSPRTARSITLAGPGARVWKQIDSRSCRDLTDDVLGGWCIAYLVSPASLGRALERLLGELERPGFVQASN